MNRLEIRIPDLSCPNAQRIPLHDHVPLAGIEGLIARKCRVEGQSIEEGHQEQCHECYYRAASMFLLCVHKEMTTAGRDCKKRMEDGVKGRRTMVSA